MAPVDGTEQDLLTGVQSLSGIAKPALPSLYAARINRPLLQKNALKHGRAAVKVPFCLFLVKPPCIRRDPRDVNGWKSSFHTPT